ncbi:hypothetical protein BS78_02G310900 [Paspalum vaginatum]|nr:hypothetical protein BS78_02G310900 [Paspalum vaginatum]
MVTSRRRRVLPRLVEEATAVAPAPGQLQSLNSDLLRNIFLRVAADLGDLARVSATCSSFHDLISEQSFRRRYRSLYPPLLLGVFAHDHDFQPVEAPHPNARFARSLAFDDDYLLPREWIRCDVCDGRVLLMRPLEEDEGEVLDSDEDLDWDWESSDEDDDTDELEGSVFVFPDLAVCDPLHRVLRQLPPIPEDVIASVPVNDPRTRCLEALLVPSGHQEDTSFKVIVRANCRNRLTAFIFSSDSSLWSHGCFYWKVNWRNKLLKLDINRTEFSTVDLPAGSNEREFVTVVEEQAEEGGEGSLGMFSLTRDARSMLYFTRSVQNGGGGGHEWLHKELIPLPCYCNMVGAFEGYIFLRGVQTSRRRVAAAFFSLEIKTRKIDRLCSTKTLVSSNLHPYFGYTPFMSPRRVLLEW